MLFIAQAVANSSDDMLQLREPFEWLKSGLSIVEDDMGLWNRLAQKVAGMDPVIAQQLSVFLQEVDVPISRIRFDAPAPLQNELTGLTSVMTGQKLEKS